MEIKMEGGGQCMEETLLLSFAAFGMIWPYAQILVLWTISSGGKMINKNKHYQNVLCFCF